MIENTHTHTHTHRDKSRKAFLSQVKEGRALFETGKKLYVFKEKVAWLGSAFAPTALAVIPAKTNENTALKITQNTHFTVTSTHFTTPTADSILRKVKTQKWEIPRHFRKAAECERF